MKSRRWLMRLLAAVVFLALAAVGWSAWTRHQIQSAKARCQAAGLAMTIDEIRPPAVAIPDNACPLIEQIDTLLKAPPLQGPTGNSEIVAQLDKFRTADVRPFAADELAAIAQTLATPAVQAVLTLAREAAAKPGYDAHLGYELGPALVINNVGPLRQSVAMLGASARLAALRNDPDGAAADLGAMLALAELLRTEPTLISQLTRLASVGITIDVLEKIIAAQGLSRRGCEAIAARLKPIDWRDGFVRALNAERVVFGGYCFEPTGEKMTARQLASVAGSDPTSSLVAVASLYQISGMLRLDYADYLDRMRGMTLEVRNASHTLAEQNEALKRIGSGIPRLHVMTLLATPNVATIWQKTWQGQQKLAVTRIGLGLERYRQQHGDYPAELSALTPEFVPEIPLDAFSGKPLRYERSAHGALVYSVGPNLRDDGGARDQATQKDDLTWRAGDKLTSVSL